MDVEVRLQGYWDGKGTIAEESEIEKVSLSFRKDSFKERCLEGHSDLWK